MSIDPRETIASSALSRAQIIVIALCVMLNGLDGFDVLSISFASPGIADEWGIDRAALGIVLSMELIGMAVGSIMLGNVADQIGRRKTTLLCLVIMASGMLGAAFSSGVVMLSIIRFVTGLGIGGMLAVTNAMVAEFSNAKRRGLAVSLMATGYPIGAIIGGSVASVLLAHYDWRSVFFLGAGLTVALIPLVLVFIPESVSWLVHKRPENALAKINTTMKRLGHVAIDVLPPPPAITPKVGVIKLFSPELRVVTILLTCTYFFQIMAFYYLLKWIPKIVVDMGFAASSAGGVLVWANIGGAVGSVLLGLLTQRFDVRFLTTTSMLFSLVMLTVFGFSENDLSQLAALAAASGFCTNSAVVGLYAIMAHSFPTDVRAGGTGFVIGVGRGGAALSPILAGFLFESGQSLPTVSFIMGTASLIAAGFLIAFIFYARKTGMWNNTHSS